MKSYLFHSAKTFKLSAFSCPHFSCVRVVPVWERDYCLFGCLSNLPVSSYTVLDGWWPRETEENKTFNGGRVTRRRSHWVRTRKHPRGQERSLVTFPPPFCSYSVLPPSIVTERSRCTKHILGAWNTSWYEKGRDPMLCCWHSRRRGK